MKPFNITEALAHPERVIHKDGSRAIQVAHFPNACPHWRILVLWNKDSAPMSYDEDGAVSPRSKPVLFLSPPPERVPFTIEDFKKGWEVVYRNGEKPLEVKVFEFCETAHPVAAVDASKAIGWHDCNGRYFVKGDSPRDLFLIKPATT